MYNPKVSVMPRIAFSFPISDEAVFFAHYDVLTQRPTGFSRLDLLGYAYIENTGDILTNPEPEAHQDDRLRAGLPTGAQQVFLAEALRILP